MEPSSQNKTQRLEMLKQMLREIHAGKSLEYHFFPYKPAEPRFW